MLLKGCDTQETHSTAEEKSRKEWVMNRNVYAMTGTFSELFMFSVGKGGIGSHSHSFYLLPS